MAQVTSKRAKVTFHWDPRFDENLYRASRYTNSSLHPLYDKVRDVTDQIAKRAKTSIQNHAKAAEFRVDAIKHSDWHSDFGGVGKKGWLEAKAQAFALKSAAAATVPTMGYDGKEIYGRVVINRKHSNTLEFGGADLTAEMGKGTGEYVVHPAYSFLRNAMR